MYKRCLFLYTTPRLIWTAQPQREEYVKLFYGPWNGFCGKTIWILMNRKGNVTHFLFEQSSTASSCRYTIHFFGCFGIELRLMGSLKRWTNLLGVAQEKNQPPIVVLAFSYALRIFPNAYAVSLCIALAVSLSDCFADTLICGDDA